LPIFSGGTAQPICLKFSGIAHIHVFYSHCKNESFSFKTVDFFHSALRVFLEQNFNSAKNV